MNVHVFKLDKNSFDKPGVLSVERVTLQNEKCLYLNTLQISNLKTSGPTKTFKAGLFNIPLVRYGSSITMDIKDALGDVNSLKNFFGLSIVDGENRTYIYKGTKHSTPVALEGELKIMNAETREINTVYLFIPCFVPNGHLEIIADSGSNMGVFDLSGTIYPIKVSTYKTGTQDIDTISVQYYSISDKSVCEISNNFNFVIKDEDSVEIVSIPYLYNFETGDYIYDKDMLIIDCSTNHAESTQSDFINNKDAIQIILGKNPDEN